MAVIRINMFQAAPEKEDELYSFLHSLTSYITSCDGCLSYEVLKDIDAPDHFIALEKWTSIEAHKKSIEGFPKENMQAAMPLFRVPPAGSYYENQAD